MSLLAFALALSAQTCPAANPCPPLVPAPDAPSVEAARAWMQAEVDLAERHNNDAEPALVNATTSLTPEAEHVATGARCRFWFGAADISFTLYDGSHMSCGTSLGWVTTGAVIYRRADRPRMTEAWFGAEARLASATPRDVALARAAFAEREAPGQTRAEIADAREWTTPGGRHISYVAATIVYPGGAPEGTPSRRHTRLYAALIGEWMLIYSADGPIHYRATLDDYAETGFGRLIASVEAAGRIIGQPQ